MTQAEAQKQDDLEVQWVRFSLADETYGIAARQVHEVVRVADVTPVPGADAKILGIVNLRGIVVTVLDMRILLGLPKADINEASRIIIADSAGQTVGLLVDSVAEVVYLRASEIETAPKVGKDEGSSLVRGVYSNDEGLLIMIDIEPLMSMTPGVALGEQ